MGERYKQRAREWEGGGCTTGICCAVTNTAVQRARARRRGRRANIKTIHSTHAAVIYQHMEWTLDDNHKLYQREAKAGQKILATSAAGETKERVWRGKEWPPWSNRGWILEQVGVSRGHCKMTCVGDCLHGKKWKTLQDTHLWFSLFVSSKQKQTVKSISWCLSVRTKWTEMAISESIKVCINKLKKKKKPELPCKHQDEYKTWKKKSWHELIITLQQVTNETLWLCFYLGYYGKESMP